MTKRWIVHGIKWFDKVNGNTYHSVKVKDLKGKEIAKSNFNYGYGDQWKQTAFEEMQKLKLYSKRKRKNGTCPAYERFKEESIFSEPPHVNTQKELKGF